MNIMKYATALFVTAVLGLAAAQTTPAAAPATATQTLTATADPTLSTSAITIETGRYQGPLSSLLGAIAQSAGYELVLEVNVDNLSSEGTQARPVAYSFRNKPFNEVWPLLMDVYGLNYSISELGGQPVIRVNNTAVQRVVDLKAAEASYVVERTRVFFGSPVAAQGQAAAPAGQGTPAATTSTPAPTQYQFDSKTLRVIADNVTNRVIIRGNNQEVREVEAFVRDLDASAQAQRQQQEALYGTDAASTRREIYAANSDATQLLPFLQGQFPALRITGVPGGRGLIIDGNSTTVDEALALLRKVDPASGDVTTQEIFRLVNANATEVAETLTNTLARQLTAAAANSGSTTTTAATNNTAATTTTNSNGNVVSEAVKLAGREATIIPDSRTNSLIVRGTPAQVAQVAELLPILDQRVPQINLQVRIQSIENISSRSLGVDWSATAGGFNIAVGTSGVTSTFNPLQSAMGFNIFPTLNALERQSLAKRVYDGTVSLQSGQRIIGSKNNVSNDLSGASAVVRSGGEIEYVTNTSGTVRQVPYGVILSFSNPVVAPDGTITVNVAAEISELQNPESLDTPNPRLNFSKSRAETKISFKPGETVLLSGLDISTSTAEDRGAPILSQIPGIGALFGQQTQGRNSTQMLFVITGDIIK